MIPSQNVIFETQVNNFFILWKSHVPSLGYSDISILNYFISFNYCDVMMSIETRVTQHF